MRAALAIAAMVLPKAVLAHGGNPAEARIGAPSEVGVIADDRFLITWIDSNRPAATGTATVELFYTDRMPPTFFPGAIPSSLDGTPITRSIREIDFPNYYEWNTSTVAPGTYWIWSRVNDPPEPIPSPIYISFSPAPLHVQHPGDPLGPSVRITRPSTEISYSDEEFELRWQAFAPNGPATIRLEAGTSLDGSDFMVIADDLAATSTGSFVWETNSLEEADWTIRAVITDDTGSFTAYCPYYLLITHFIPIRDAGVIDAAPVMDAGSVIDAATTMLPVPMVEEEGCGCSAAPSAGSASWIFVLITAGIAHLPVRRERGRRSDPAPPDRTPSTLA